MVQVRPLRKEDITFALQLTDSEEWGYTPEDFHRFTRLEPEGCLVAWEGQRRVGVTVVTTYGEAAWIGSVIVTPQERGKGLGQVLVEAALDYAESKGVTTSWLNSYLQTVAFYKRLGFKPAGETVRLSGMAEGTLQHEVKLASRSDIETIASFDRGFFGAPRLKLLWELYHDHGESFLLWRVGEPLGYIVGAPFPGGVEVGPWVVEPSRPEVGGMLLQHLLALYEGRTFTLSAPRENLQAQKLLAALGFQEAFRTVRMYKGRGEPGMDLQGIYAVAGLEKG